MSGTGLFTPSATISNQELTTAFNEYVKRYNETHHQAIAKGELNALAFSDPAFIEKASGIKSRHVMEKDHILDPEVMQPIIQERSDDQIGIQAEMGLAAAHDAIKQAGKHAQDIDMVIVACSNMQRPFPAVAIELQHHLGIHGSAFDLNVACSSATFGIQTAYNAIKAETARCVLVVNPEICSAQLNFRDRDSHFIFGDAATAAIIESANTCHCDQDSFELIDCQIMTEFSNNIRNNGGFLSRTWPETRDNADKLFYQNGRKVFKEVTLKVTDLINTHLARHHMTSKDIKRLWLHQANLSMNNLIAQKVLGHAPSKTEMPIVLDQYANTSSAGSMIAFHLYHQDFQAGDMGLLCSFGAGYSIGNIILRKI